MNTREIALLGIYVSLFIILSFVPYTGYISVGAVRFTTIPALLALSTYHLGFKGAITSGIAFGLGSYISSVTISPSWLSDPVILFVPRFLLGFIIYGFYKLLGEIKLWKFITLAVLAVLFNTILVSSALFLVNSYSHIYDGTIWVWITLIYVNFLVEIAIGILIAIIFYKIALLGIENVKKSSKNRW
ncbi:MAG: hypothetical protein HRT99_03565 [Mycoplasmatales bacterium]|nr:hypothetical protein [Mycoplasmatales bacterium]